MGLVEARDAADAHPLPFPWRLELQRGNQFGHELRGTELQRQVPVAILHQPAIDDQTAGVDVRVHGGGDVRERHDVIGARGQEQREQPGQFANLEALGTSSVIS